MVGKDYDFWDSYFFVIWFVMNFVFIVSMGYFFVFFNFGCEICVFVDVLFEMCVIVENDNVVLFIILFFRKFLVVLFDVWDVYEKV